MSHVNRALMLTYWDVLQVRHACCDIPAGRITSQDLWRYERSHQNSYVEYFCRVWFGFSCFRISLGNQFPSVCLCFVTARTKSLRVMCTCSEQYQKFRFFLSVILMRLCSNIDRRIARAIYKQSEIIVFDEWTKRGPYVHIAGASSGLRCLLNRCERKCRTEFLAELTGQRLSTL